MPQKEEELNGIRKTLKRFVIAQICYTVAVLLFPLMTELFQPEPSWLNLPPLIVFIIGLFGTLISPVISILTIVNAKKAKLSKGRFLLITAWSIASVAVCLVLGAPYAPNV